MLPPRAPPSPTGCPGVRPVGAVPARSRGGPAPPIPHQTVTPECSHTPGSTSRPDREDEMRDPQPTGVYATDVAGARMLGVLADILDNAVNSSRLSTHHLAYPATVAIHRLRE